MEDIPKNKVWVLSMIEGIVRVFDDEKAVEKNMPHEMPSLDKETFATEFCELLTMIADGPT